MARFFKDRSKSIGQVPGSLVFIGYKKVKTPVVDILTYNKEICNEIKNIKTGEIQTHAVDNTVVWLNITGLHETSLIADIGRHFNMEQLLLEDILNTDQRPKFEEFNGNMCFFVKMLSFNREKKTFYAEHLVIYRSGNTIITFQEKPGDVLDPVRARIRNSRGRIRNSDGEYLVYAILDTIVDNYIFLIEKIGDEIEDLEDLILEKPDIKTIRQIYHYKRELNYLRKSVRPVRDMILLLMKSEPPLLSKKITRYFRDLYDLVTQSTEAIETYNLIISDQLNIYNSNVSNRSNETMKILTVFAAFFIPLTFFAGIYGMNFEYIPELKLKFGYLYFWIFIIIAGIFMYAFFRKRKWL